MPNGKSMADVAYDIMLTKKRAIQFNKLWEEVSKICKVSNDNIAQFYSDLSLDSRFASLKENKWDLTERRKYDESHIDISAIELDEDEIVTDEDGEAIINEDSY